MSVFTKALASSPFLCQAAQAHSAAANDELIAMPGARRIPFYYHRTTQRLHSINQVRGYYAQAFSAVSVINNQSHSEVASQQGPRRRGRPRKNGIENGQKSHETSTNSHASFVETTKEYSLPVFQARQGHLFHYTDVVPEVFYQQLDSEQEVSQAVVKFIVEVSRESIRSHGWFTIALPGGSLVKVLKALVDEPGIDWTKWHVFWVDERVVPLTDDDSNFKLAMGTFLSKAKIPKDQVHHIKYGNDAKVVAQKYDQLMRSMVKRKVLSLDSSGDFPQFDLILLGIGPDGHVASLFPNSLALAEERDWVVAVLNSPKPPPERISMTLPCINAASHVCFVIVGSGKAEVVQRILERPALPGALPAQMVRPWKGVLHWYLDKAAAANLSVDTWADPKKFPAVNYAAPQR